jgi:hypothetical protein
MSGTFFVLENPAIGRSRQEPEFWHNNRLIACQSPDVIGLTERPDVAIEEARLALNGVEPNGDIFADDLPEREVEILADQIGINLKKPSKLFRGSEAAQRELGFFIAKWRMDCNLSSGLIEWHRWRLGRVRGFRSLELAR